MSSMDLVLSEKYKAFFEMPDTGGVPGRYHGSRKDYSRNF